MRAILFLMFFAAIFPASFSQDQSGDDSYDEYSYLWNESSKEKKNKNKKADQDSLKSESPKKERKKADPPAFGDFRSGTTSSTDEGNRFNGGLTITQIGDQTYAGMTLNPELNLGKIGVGLNIPILYGFKDQKIRTEIFKDGVGVARLITYLRLGVQKSSPIYAKVGQLNNTMIGFGGIVNNYTNSTSFEKRTIGLHYDVNYDTFVGIEGMYSDFNPGSFNLFAIRPYVRPLAYTGIPIINTFEIGTTLVKDKDQNNMLTGETSATTYKLTKDGVGAFGFDAGLTLVRVPFIQIDLFANYTKLDVVNQAVADSLLSAAGTTMENGSGQSVGLNFRFNFIADLVSADMRIERLANSKYYQSQFFDATYQMNKDAKIFGLSNADKMSGIYGSLTGQILKKIIVGGSLMIPDNVSDDNPAMLRINADLDRLADKFSFQGSYIRGNIGDLKDAIKFDDRSLAKVRAVYHLNKFIATGLDYYWAFIPDGEGGYKPDKYISPYFGLSIQF